MSDPSSEFGKSSNPKDSIAPWLGRDLENDRQTPEAYAEFFLFAMRNHAEQTGERITAFYRATRDSWIDEDISRAYEEMEEPTQTLFRQGVILAMKQLNLEKPEDVRLARLMIGVSLDDATNKTILAIVTHKSELMIRDTDELKELDKACTQIVMHRFMEDHKEMCDEPWAAADLERFKKALQARNSALEANPSPT